MALHQGAAPRGCAAQGHPDAHLYGQGCERDARAHQRALRRPAPRARPRGDAAAPDRRGAAGGADIHHPRLRAEHRPGGGAFSPLRPRRAPDLAPRGGAVHAAGGEGAGHAGLRLVHPNAPARPAFAGFPGRTGGRVSRRRGDRVLPGGDGVVRAFPGRSPGEPGGVARRPAGAGGRPGVFRGGEAAYPRYLPPPLPRGRRGLGGGLRAASVRSAGKERVQRTARRPAEGLACGRSAARRAGGDACLRETAFRRHPRQPQGSDDEPVREAGAGDARLLVRRAPGALRHALDGAPLPGAGTGGVRHPPALRTAAHLGHAVGGLQGVPPQTGAAVVRRHDPPGGRNRRARRFVALRSDVPRDPRGRVPGYEPAAGPPDRVRGRRREQALPGGRPETVDLPLPPRRPDALWRADRLAVRGDGLHPAANKLPDAPRAVEGDQRTLRRDMAERHRLHAPRALRGAALPRESAGEGTPRRDVPPARASDLPPPERGRADRGDAETGGDRPGREAARAARAACLEQERKKDASGGVARHHHPRAVAILIRRARGDAAPALRHPRRLREGEALLRQRGNRRSADGDPGPGVSGRQGGGARLPCLPVLRSENGAVRALSRPGRPAARAASPRNGGQDRGAAERRPLLRPLRGARPAAERPVVPGGVPLMEPEERARQPLEGARPRPRVRGGLRQRPGRVRRLRRPHGRAQGGGRGEHASRRRGGRGPRAHRPQREGVGVPHHRGDGPEQHSGRRRGAGGAHPLGAAGSGGLAPPRGVEREERLRDRQNRPLP